MLHFWICPSAEIPSFWVLNGLRWSLLCVALVCQPSCAPDPPERPPNIVLITVDTLRADHMSLYGYERETTPEIDAWFGEGAVFERAYATTSFTPPSVISFLTGLYPQRHGVRYYGQRIDENLETLGSWLGDLGYERAAFVANISLRAKALGLGPHFDHYDDEMTEQEAFRSSHYERSAAPNTDAALEWLANRSDPERPFFLWIHYMDPHGPYTPPAPKVRDFEHAGEKAIDPERVPLYQRYEGLTDGLEYIDLYDEEIAHVDHHIGRLLEGLKRHTIPEQTIYALTADHGECLMEHGYWFSHGFDIFEDVVRVPLAFRGPGIAPRREDAPVSIVDIPPTLMAAIGQEPPKGLDGVPLVEPGRPNVPVFIESIMDATSGYWKGVLDDSRKWAVFTPAPGAEPEFMIFDTAGNPAEDRYVAWDPAESEGASQELLRRLDSDPHDLYSAKEWLEEVKKDPETAEQLKALGYL